MCIDCQSFLHGLIAKGLLIETGVDGLYARGGAFEDVVSRYDALITRFGGGDGAEVIRLPPGMNRAHFEKAGYMKTFPQLAGTVTSFDGNERQHGELIDKHERGEDWTALQKATDIVLTPAACYPLYPIIARRGALPQNGGLYDIKSYCFRHEPSHESTRMQMFRMREYVRIGSPDEVTEFRATWLERTSKFMGMLGIPFEIDVANDPFFGRVGKVLASSQRDQKLKFEMLVPIENAEKPTACISFNYHQDHFGALWDIKRHDGEIAHTACIGFGIERAVLALFKHHGLDTASWPASVRDVLWG
jgi:seryl-tRNA synthetase